MAGETGRAREFLLRGKAMEKTTYDLHPLLAEKRH
jgi:hypothetical protein